MFLNPFVSYLTPSATALSLDLVSFFNIASLCFPWERNTVPGDRIIKQVRWHHWVMNLKSFLLLNTPSCPWTIETKAEGLFVDLAGIPNISPIKVDGSLLWKVPSDCDCLFESQLWKRGISFSLPELCFLHRILVQTESWLSALMDSFPLRAPKIVAIRVPFYTNIVPIYSDNIWLMQHFIHIKSPMELDAAACILQRCGC